MLKVKEDHIQKLEVIASVILPNVYKQNQNLIQINKQNIEKVKYHLQYYSPSMQLESFFTVLTQSFLLRLVPNWQK